MVLSEMIYQQIVVLAGLSHYLHPKTIETFLFL